MDEINWSMPIHAKVFSCGRCTACNAYNETQIYDYGRQTYREFEQAMDNVKHPILDLNCRKCGAKYPPEYFSYRDDIGKDEMVRVNIVLGTSLSPEESADIEEGHKRRYEIFETQAEVFWAAFTDFALEDWRGAVNELLRSEIEAGYRALGMVPAFKTDQQARRDALIHVKDKAVFWRAANDYFVREELLYIGAMGWVADLLAKRYGLRRTQFAILHFPIPEAHEPLRAQAMGKLFRRDKGDNAFLLRHIARLTDQIDATKKRVSEIYRANERLKAEVAESQRKLADAYATIKRLEESRIEAAKEPEDKRRLREQKAFIAELLAEVRRLRAMLPEEETQDPEPEDIRNEEAQPDKEPDLTHLSGLTVALIGGRDGHAELDGYPCRVLRHGGRKFDPDYYATLAAADVIVVLTRFISHAAMWDARAYAVESGKPILYSEAINVARILGQIPHINP